MTDADLLYDYAAEVLSFGFSGERAPGLPAAPAPEALERMAGRCLAAFERSGRERLVLLGLGSGGLAGALAKRLPPQRLAVCEQDLPLVRALRAAGRLDWWRRGGGAPLAADASAWAVLLLLDRAGIGPQDVLALPNPELAPAAKARLKPLELLLTRSKPLPQASGVDTPRLSVAAILSPAEPDLPGFFAQLPSWLHELVLVWDAPVLPDCSGLPLPEAFPVWQAARPLERDFAAQRNAMLEACGGDWVFSLDADERLSPEDWAALPLLCADHEAAAWHFPRVTPYPRPESALTGFGLWPDIQLRLYRRQPGLRYVNPVHERLTGIEGGQALALDVEIEHLNRLGKTDEDIRRKLAGFDAAGGGGVRHALSSEYPRVPRELLSPPRRGLPRGLLLPPDIG
ncbi:MAG: glycosyl transferase family 2 [Desulfovibrio sp.]|jgi:hypothetical protein|nr:glycosyl transferase family 2 [Desulfovibrio sp.]